MHLRKEEEKAAHTAQITEADAEGQLKSITENKSGYSLQEEMLKEIKTTVGKAHQNL